MGNCLSNRDYITPAPSVLLPDPAGPSSFKVSPSSCISSNYNVYKSSSSDDGGAAPLWLFLHSKGVSNGKDDSYLVLENFWRPPFSDDGEVLCWCHIPAFQSKGGYRNTGVEQYGESDDLHSGVYWSNTVFSQGSSASTLLWTRREWSFSTRIGFYRDRYMEEPLGVLEVSSKGWIVHRRGSNPTRRFHRSSKEISEVRYVFRDKEGTRFPIEIDMSRGKDSLRIVSFDSCLFTCNVTPSRGWVRHGALAVTTRSAIESSLGLLLGFVCGNSMSPQSIVANLRISQSTRSWPACSSIPRPHHEAESVETKVSQTRERSGNVLHGVLSFLEWKPSFDMLANLSSSAVQITLLCLRRSLAVLSW